MSNIIDYSLSNEKLYTKEFLNKRAYKLFITIPHTDVTVSECIEKFRGYKQVVYCKVAQEHHEDGDTHIHMFMSFKLQVKYSTLFSLLKELLSSKRIQGAINFQVPKSNDAVCKYIDKEGNTQEFGNRPERIGKPLTGQESRNKGASHAIDEARKGNIAEAMEILLEHQPMRMLENGDNIVENLKKLNQTRKKYELPIFTKENTKFKKWQQQLVDLVSTTPKKRRIIWVVGEPESGKTFIHDYLANIENYEYGLYDAGQSVSYDNVVYGYDEEGIISWDFPMNYDWATYETQAGNLIEKFSDFGTIVSSKKYKGSSKYIRGHVLVFSNREPLENLKHRDIITIRASKENVNTVNTEENMEKVNKVNKINKINKINEILPEEIVDNENIVNKILDTDKEKVNKIHEKLPHQVKLENDLEHKLNGLKIKLNGLSHRLMVCEKLDMNYAEQEALKKRMAEVKMEILEVNKILGKA